MSTIEDAAHTLAAAELQRARAETILRVVAETHEQASEAYRHANLAVQEATAALVTAVHPPQQDRVVKRPAETADTLLNLDDVGGR